MKQKLTVELEVPEGWKLVGYRPALPKEHFIIAHDGINVFPCGRMATSGTVWVVEKIPAAPKAGEMWRNKSSLPESLFLKLHSTDVNGHSWLLLNFKGSHYLRGGGSKPWEEIYGEWEKLADSYTEWIALQEGKA